MDHLDGAAADDPGAGHAAAAVGGHAKERRLGFGGQQHAAVERHEGRRAVVRAGMNGPRNEPAAGAGLAGQHEASRGGRGFAHQREHLAHGGRLADEPEGLEWVAWNHGRGHSFAL